MFQSTRSRCSVSRTASPSHATRWLLCDDEERMFVYYHRHEDRGREHRHESTSLSIVNVNEASISYTSNLCPISVSNLLRLLQASCVVWWTSTLFCTDVFIEDRCILPQRRFPIQAETFPTKIVRGNVVPTNRVGLITRWDLICLCRRHLVAEIAVWRLSYSKVTTKSNND